MKKLLTIVIIILLAGMSFAGEYFTVKDSYGNKVKIKKCPQRIVSLNPSVTEILYSLGLDNKIVAVSNNCNYPVKAKNKPKIGDLSLNYERIISLKPDIVIAEGSIFKDTLDKLKSLNIPVFLVSCDNLKEFQSSFIILGKALGKESKAKELMNAFNYKLDKIKKRAVNIKDKPKVFVEIWNQPLMTASKGTFIDEIIQISAGENIAKNLNNKYPVVNTEFLIKNNPDIIILTTNNPDDIYNNKVLKNINAVKNKKVYKISPDIIARPTLRLAEAASQIYNWVCSYKPSCPGRILTR
ncbi:MAG: helical backbone metal receptor [Armatimonadota bacterium]